MDWTLVSFGLAALSGVLLFLLYRAQNAPPPDNASAQLAARLDGMFKLINDNQSKLADSVNAGQSRLAGSVNERLDSVSARLGVSLTDNRDATAESLKNLTARLAVIDAAQKGMTDLAGQVTSLQGVLAGKQSRGAFGQWRMETIVQDNLPAGAFAFQHTLSNKLRPDCVIFMPDKRPLVVDSKFPLEAMTAHQDAQSDEERKAAAGRVRSDMQKHIADIASKYLLPGETQDTAFMFVPSEAVYASLHEHFDDLVQKAYRARVFIVSPTILMLAIQVLQSMRRDERMREAADQIRDEVIKLLDDVARLADRVRNLGKHFGQVTVDVQQAVISLDKIESRGERIRQAEIEPPAERPSLKIASK